MIWTKFDWICLIMIFSCLMGLIGYEMGEKNAELKFDMNYCELYAEQDQTEMRFGDGETQFLINSQWVPESELKEDCLK